MAVSTAAAAPTPSQYAVEADGGLDQYTTNELIAEINRRMNG